MLTPDLRGHGERAHVRPVDLPSCVGDVLGDAPASFLLAGYSLGARVALAIALAAPSRVASLVLVAGTAGIRDVAERRSRAVADEALAVSIEEGGLEAFVGGWMALPIFAGTPPAARAVWEADLRRGTPDGLAAALRGLGQGACPPVWDRLRELTMPVTVVVGARDAKYRAIADELVAALPDPRLVVVPGAGHGLPREAPDALAAVLRGDLSALGVA